MIKSIYTAVPRDKYEVSELLSSAPDMSRDKIEEIISSTGISNTRILNDDLNTSDLFYKSASAAVDDYGEEIDALICVTQTPDYLCPNVASLLHHRLGLPKTCLTFDINQGCSGYIYGLYIANQIIKSKNINSILLCVGDANHKNIKKDNYSVRSLFGDAGSTTLIVGDGVDDSLFLFGSDGKGAKHLGVPSYGFRKPNTDNDVFSKLSPDERDALYMDGAQVFMFGIREVPKFVNNFMRDKKTDYLVFHQANKSLLDAIEKKLDFNFLPLYSLHEYGNTSSATIPLSICNNEIDFSNKNILMCGFGIGWSWGQFMYESDSNINTKILEL